MNRVKNDRALRFYKDVLGMERLHYGLWLDDDPLSFDKLEAAQQRYEDFLIENIPGGIKHILDVGCGTGAMSSRLKQLGYAVEGLSPDVNQKNVFTEKVDAPFHFCCFEDFKSKQQYDMIIMSESCQYIPFTRLFKVCKRTLRPGGHLMICDYFILDNAEGVFSKSGHPYEEFINEASQQHFMVLHNEDITGQVSKTLDLAQQYLDRILLGLDIATQKLRYRHPFLSRFVTWLFRNRVQHFEEQRQLLDSEKFMANKTYRFLLLQWQNEKLSSCFH